jgi:hypothetical protein
MFEYREIADLCVSYDSHNKHRSFNTHNYPIGHCNGGDMCCVMEQI